jgi:hypothetical protein
MIEGAPRPDTQKRTVEHHHAVREDLGLSPELLASWALRRAHRGGVAKSGDQYVDHGRLRLSYLARTFAELTEAGLLTPADEDPWGLRRLSLTETGRAHYAQLSTRRMRLSVPKPEFPPQTPAGRRVSGPDPLDAPGGQPDPGTTMVRIPTEMPDPDLQGSVAEIAQLPASWSPTTR